MRKISIQDVFIKNEIEFIPQEIEFPNFDLLTTLQEDAIQKVVDGVLKKFLGKVIIDQEDYKKLTRFTWPDEPDVFGLSYDNTALGIIKMGLEGTRYTVTFTAYSKP